MILSSAAAPLFASTIWYVNPTTGGTRYSASNTSGQCNGQSASAYVSGVNQPCPYNDFRLMWDDPFTTAALAWVISGGDTIIVSGFEQSTGLIGVIAGSTNSSGSGDFCWGTGVGCDPPDLPSGTSGNPTTIEGVNCETSCGVSVTGLGYEWQAPDPTKVEYMTSVISGGGETHALEIGNAQWVIVKGLDINGQNATAYGISTVSAGTNANVVLQDLDLHTFDSRGVIGNIAGLWTATRVELEFNEQAGWDFDNNSGNPFTGGVFVGSYLGIDWNGCNGQFPASNPIPVNQCFDQDSGGYGDGVGTPTTQMNWSCDHCRATYNTQDGFDLGHITGGNVSITDSWFAGNMGGNLKAGPGATTTFINNTVNSNCLRMDAPITGVISTYNTPLSLFCRSGDANSGNFLSASCYVGGCFPNGSYTFSGFTSAGTTVTGSGTHFLTDVTVGQFVAPYNEDVSWRRQVTAIATDTSLTLATAFPSDVTDSSLLLISLPTSSSVVTIEHNTVVGYEGAVWDFNCMNYAILPEIDPSNCGGYTMTYKDNAVLGYSDQGGSLPSMFTSMGPSSGAADYNVSFNLQFNPSIGTHDLYLSPLFVGQPASPITAESQLDNFNYNLTSGSPAKGAGVVLSGQTADQAGNAWATPPSMGALEFVNTSGPTSTVTGQVTITGLTLRQ